MVLTDYPAKSLIHSVITIVIFLPVKTHLCGNDYRDPFVLSLFVSHKQSSSHILQKCAVTSRRKIIIMPAS